MGSFLLQVHVTGGGGYIHTSKTTYAVGDGRSRLIGRNRRHQQGKEPIKLRTCYLLLIRRSISQDAEVFLNLIVVNLWIDNITSTKKDWTLGCYLQYMLYPQ